MRFLLIVTLSLLPLLAYAAALGEARDRSGRLLYTERHTVEGSRHYIEYRDAKGELFASSHLDYRFGDTHPAYRQEKRRVGALLGGRISGDSIEGARWRGGQLELFHADGVSGRAPERVKVIAAPQPQPLVLNAGFDHFVRDHWQALQRGDVLRFHFALPARLMLVELRARRIDAPADVELPAGGLALRTDPVSPLWRLLSRPLDLFYDGEHRLLRYRGVSTLELGENAPWVDVTYRYDEAAPAGAAAPLTSSR